MRHGANNSFKQPRGIYVLDSVAGTSVGGVPMRDGNVRNKPFVDGYVLRTEWATLEPTDGVFDFTIIDNILSKLTPYNQKLSLMVASGVLPAWLNTVPGVVTYTGWHAERDHTAAAMGCDRAGALPPVARGSEQSCRSMACRCAIIHGSAALDTWIPGLKSGIRDPMTVKIRDICPATRANAL